ncbi:hypothetical protein FSB78_18425 [Sphingomonas ginsenosidivorax]|uniref:Uncharacterized protein n=1 Tax=Sphingomonas ginsenosidivorax TaxID=862135 RepID=A0A5C6U8I2_9SPHN|nr:hypothetical protein [Sphingomonas ginsenosidivorax]TXC67965.1 hypothetical protein FSB78_18425 [Sphingomonas ginsenosidivorax]
MFYDTHYRHNEALSPEALTTLPAALHALNAGVDDCRRAGKPIERDASIILLIRNLAAVAERDMPSTNDLRLRCAEDRMTVIASSALLAIAGNSVAGDAAAKRTFHRQARLALASLAEAIGLSAHDVRINTDAGGITDDGTTELRHADLSIRVRPHSFLPDSEITFNRCWGGEHAGPVERAPIAELLDAAAFQRRLAATVGDVGAPRLAAAA